MKKTELPQHEEKLQLVELKPEPRRSPTWQELNQRCDETLKRIEERRQQKQTGS